MPIPNSISRGSVITMKCVFRIGLWGFFASERWEMSTFSWTLLKKTDNSPSAVPFLPAAPIPSLQPLSPAKAPLLRLLGKLHRPVSALMCHANRRAIMSFCFHCQAPSSGLSNLVNEKVNDWSRPLAASGFPRFTLVQSLTNPFHTACSMPGFKIWWVMRQHFTPLLCLCIA